MEKIYAVIELLKLFLELLKDDDKDGRPNLWDSEPQNPEVK